MILRPVRPASPCDGGTEVAQLSNSQATFQAKFLKTATSDDYLRASDNKPPTGLQVVDGVVIQIDAGNNSLDDLFLKGISHLFQANVRVMLDRDDNCVHTHW